MMIHKSKILALQLLVPVFFGGIYYLFNFEIGALVWWHLAWFLAGIFIGGIILLLDEKVFVKQYDPEYQLPLSRSVLFLGVFLVLAILLAYSGGTLIGSGLVLGIGYNLLAELYFYSKNSEAFHNRFLYQVTRRLSQQEINWLVTAFAGFIVVITIIYFT